MNVTFSIVALVALVAWSPSCSLHAQTPEATISTDSPTDSRGPAAQSSLDATRDRSANDLLRDAQRRIAAHNSIKAKLRLRSKFLEQSLVGNGEYAQLKASVGLLLRTQLTIQGTEQSTSVTQISNGRDLWEHWQLGQSQHFHHVDLAQIQRAMQNAHPTLESPATNRLAIGGLPQLLSELLANFDFSHVPPRQDVLRGEPVWVANGIWRFDKLAQIAPAATENQQVAIERLPAHIPHHVELVLGQADLFPYRTAYHQYHTHALGQELLPILTIELYEVALGGELDPSQFDYQQPSNVGVVDRTDSYLESLGLARRPEAEAAR